MSAPALVAPAASPEVLRCLESTASEYGSSRWGSYRRCEREHHLRYVEGVRRLPVVRSAIDGKPSPLVIGQLCHSVLQFVSESVMHRDSADVLGWPHVLVAAEKLGRDPAAVDEAERLMTAYWAHYGLGNAGWPAEVKLIACEQPLADIVGSLPFTGTADLIVDRNGEILVPDHKTRASKVPEDAARKWATREQFISLSRAVMRKHGLDSPPSIWVNAIVKTKIPGFERTIVRITHDMIARWEQNQTLLAARGLTGSAMNYSSCAPDIGSECDFISYCHSQPEGRALIWNTAAQRLQKAATAKETPIE